ncbi:hypothetical protein OSB04_005148 [Centaurea solstitialis]|uniref:Uncharacterized protein n=1 Tax=Centaurea solstitialis TaxID=347529 RepID=A0AA38U041_9ASTR|nr:hypothetical protein OSB04_005148 [Centaurea solstitialis]
MTTREALAIGSDTKPPVLFRGDYNMWRDRFLDFIDRQDLGEYIRLSLKEGPKVFTEEKPAQPDSDPPVAAHTVLKKFEDMTVEEKNRHKADKLAKSFMLLGLPNDIYFTIDSHNSTGKEMWDQIEKQMLGTSVGTQMKVTNIIKRYEQFKAREEEKLDETYERFCNLLNELRKNGITKTKIENNVKFLTNLQPVWKIYSNSVFQNKSLADIDIHVVYEILKQSQDDVQDALDAKVKSEKEKADTLALMADKRGKQVVHRSRARSDSSDTPEVSSDSDLFKGDKLVSWASKKQNCVSLSTAEAEYVAAASCCSQIIWMRTQLRDYGFKFDKIPIYCDSKSAIAISCNPVQHTKTKHIDIRYHFINDHVEKGTIELYFVNTEFQLADLFTKALDEKRFNFLITKLGMRTLKN